MEIKEGNKLIAEFMGLNNGFDSPSVYKHPFESRICFSKDLKYHSSWDWLMPVVEKIENIALINACVDISKNTVMVSVKDGDLVFHGNVILDKSKTEGVWLAVVEFIKWYNQNLKP